MLHYCINRTFDFLSHALMIAKRHAYSFDKASLKLVLDYLTNKQRVKIKDSMEHYEIQCTTRLHLWPNIV